jgi:C4-dicarboxylate-specific signal transduction histidine kinase
LNNPLSSMILGHTAILCQTSRDESQRARAEKIAQASERCARIVKNFLAIARERPPERESVSLPQVVEEAVELLAYHLRSDGVDVVMALADDVPALWADPHQLHQVVVNLVSNAHHALRKSSPPPTITVTSRFESARAVVRLEVADTGPGVPPEVRSRIFDPFFTTKPTGEGAGLGLSLCQGIIEAQQARPNLTSRFVFMTGDSLSTETRQFIERAGALSLSKPFAPDEVRRVVRRALERAESAPR